MKALFLIGVLLISEVLATEGDTLHSSPPKWYPRSHRGVHFGARLGDNNVDQLELTNDRNRWIFDPWNSPITEKFRIIFPVSDSIAGIDSVSSTAKPIGLDLVIESCKNACPVTTEHNPVCGTDNVTYGNIGLLECARTCGVDVQLKRISPCDTTNNGRTDGTNNGGTGGNNNGGTGGNNNGRDNKVIQACMRSCPVTSEYNPVCGTDNVTYENMGLLECSRTCGVDVQLKRRSPCRKVNKRSSSDYFRVENCVMGCSETSVFDPVCGTNNVTYANLDRLQCAQRCGLAVNILSHSSCSAVHSWDADIEICISTCPVTPGYSPVCGSDNRTYVNEGMFQCAKNCGRNIQIIKRTSCSVPDTIDPWGPTSTPTNKPLNPWDTNIPSPNKPFDPWGINPPSPNKPFNPWGINPPSPNKPFDPWGINPPSPNKPFDPWGPTNPSPNGNENCKGNTNGNCNGNNPNPSGSTPSPNGNGNGSNGGGSGSRTPSITEILACMQLCHNTPEVNPVCGTDGVTYTNAGHLLCAQSCGVDVKVRMFAPCSGTEVRPTPNPTLPTPNPNPTPTSIPILTTTSTTRPTPNPTTIPTTTSTMTPVTTSTTTPIPTKVPNPPSIQDCVNKCLVSLELKPVCGTDGVTYINIESLRCKMNCGDAVAVLKESPCESSTPPPTAATPPVWQNTVSPTQPTAVSPDAMPKPQASNHEACINACIMTQGVDQPICGTDGITYPNFEAFQCAKRCGISLDIKSLSTCGSGPKNEATTDTNLGFTISSPLIMSIFTTYKPQTKNVTPIDDSAEDLDERYGTP